MNTLEKNNSIYALVDCNCFYCSCERLFRPELNKIPVGVLSNNDGCFVSRSDELKQLGIAMGAPYFQVKKILDKANAAVFSANFALYTNMSDRVMNNLFEFTPSLEVYSIDEAFLDLSGFDEKTIVDYCRHIKETVERNTGIPVCIGIGRNKVQAKIANRIAKKNKAKTMGVYSVLSSDHLEWSLTNVQVEDLWGIGRQLSKRLLPFKIRTAKDLRDFNNDKLILKMFHKPVRQIQDELRGALCFPITPEPPKKKEILCSRSFGTIVTEKNVLRESLASFSSWAAEKLRRQESVCGSIEIYIGTSPFLDEHLQYHRSHFRILDGHTCDTRKIIKEAWALLDEIFQTGYIYKKAMVKLSNIQDKNEYQPSLFGKTDSIEDLKIMSVMDAVNKRDGEEALKLAACGTSKEAWFMKQTLRSPRYVTGWTELCVIGKEILSSKS